MINFKYSYRIQTYPFDPMMGPLQVLPLWVKVEYSFSCHSLFDDVKFGKFCYF